MMMMTMTKRTRTVMMIKAHVHLHSFSVGVGTALVHNMYSIQDPPLHHHGFDSFIVKWRVWILHRKRECFDPDIIQDCL